MALRPPSPGKSNVTSIDDARARDEAERRDRRRGEEIEARCEEIEESLEQLRTRYELYFLGVERREPARERDEMRRTVGRLKGEMNLGTGLRFRIETLHARFLSYERMWTRTARQKEEGTYRRDLHRLRRREKRAAEGDAPKQSADVRAAPSVPAAETVSATPAPAARPPVAAPALPAGLSEERLQALYTEYVEAKKRCHEDVSRITYDALARTVARQIPELLAKAKARSVEFKVLVKDGRAVLKAIPRP